MKPLFRSMWPLLLPFILSFLPIIMAFHFEGLQGNLSQEAEMEEWEEKVESRVEAFREGHSFEQQVRRLSQDFQGEIRKALARSPNGKLSGEILGREFRRTFQGIHFPPGTKLYGFSREENGATRLLTGSGLEEDWGRMISRSFSPITQSVLPDASLKREVNQRLVQIFGDLMNFEQLIVCRGKKLVKANFRKKVVHLFWDRITIRQKAVGGFIILFPETPGRIPSLKYALKTQIRKSDKDCIPLLLPIQTSSPEVHPVFLADSEDMPGMGELFKTFRRNRRTDEIAEYGKISGHIGGLKIFRAAVSMELPYDLLILKPDHGSTGPFGMLSPILFSLWFFFWFKIFLQVVRDRKPLQVSMRRWFLTYVLLVGGVPLAALFFMGKSLIEFSSDRERREQISQTRSLFETLDTNGMTAMTHFTEKSREILGEKGMKEAFCSPEVTAKHPLMKECFSRFRRAGIPLDSIFLIQFGIRNLLLTPNDETMNELREVKDFFLPLLHACFKMYEPDRFGQALTALSDFQQQTTEVALLLFNEMQFRAAGSLRRIGNFYELGDEPVFHLFDFIARENRIQAALVFRVKASEVFWILMKQMLVQTSKKFQDRPYLAVWNSPFGKKWFSPDPLRKKPQARWLIRELDEMSKAGAGHVSRRGDRAFIGYSGKRMKNLFLGTVVDFAPILERARRKLSWLVWGTLLIAGLMVFVGLSMGRYFLEPLSALEVGFRGVLRKDLDTRLRLLRDDELGDVANAFDKMVGGLKERLELGRFVSGTLNLSVEKTESLPAEPEVKIGAVLASDIRNFTTLSEQNPPEVVVEMLNLHLHLMSQEIKAHGGLIDKFIGDAIVAVFLEKDLETSTKRAIQAAQGMMARHQEIYRARSLSGKLCYGMGIGIDGGEILVGTFGSTDRLEFTVLGKPREVAEELEAKSKMGRFSKIIVSGPVATLHSGISFAKLAGTADFEIIEQ